MRYCKDCWNFDRCNVERRTVEFAVDDGVCLNFDGKPMTNADRIRAMSDEELAQAIYEMVQGPVEGLLEMFDLPARIDSVVRVEPYKKRLLSWLREPAEVDHESS